MEEEEDTVEPGDEEYLGPEELCHTCVLIPCICDLRRADRRVEMLRLEEQIKTLEEMLVKKEVGKKQKRKKEADDEEESTGTETPKKKLKNEKNTPERPHLQPLQQQELHLKGGEPVQPRLHCIGGGEAALKQVVQPLPHRIGGGELNGKFTALLPPGGWRRSCSQ